MYSIFSPTKIIDSLILMNIVIEGPLHGYALASLIEEKFGWRPSQTAVYNALKSMENEGIVNSEEKIESGRVQKIYSITEKGKNVFSETQSRMKSNMIRDFSQIFSFIQMIEEIESTEESEAFQKRVEEVFCGLRSILRVSIQLLKEEPEKTQEIIKKTLSNLRKIAEKEGIQIEEEEMNRS